MQSKSRHKGETTTFTPEVVNWFPIGPSKCDRFVFVSASDIMTVQPPFFSYVTVTNSNINTLFVLLVCTREAAEKAPNNQHQNQQLLLT